MRFPSGLSAHMHLSWLDPHKERRFTVVGSKRMATFDDMEFERNVTVYDKGFDGTSRNWGEYVARSGDIYSPAIPNSEPLRLECEQFIECAGSGRTPTSDGEAGYESCECSKVSSLRSTALGQRPRRGRRVVGRRLTR